jgi:RNA polymerase sigma factor (sigma-70 family)
LIKRISLPNVYEGMSGDLAVVAPVDVRSEDRLAALFDAHEERLYRLARRLAQRPEDARDLVQDTFLRAAQSLSRIPLGVPHEEAWLVRVLINIQRDQWRRGKVRKRLAPRPERSAADPEASLIVKRAVWSALDGLHPRRRAVVVMHELEGMPVAAIASLLGIGRVTVQWHLSMARRDLKRILHSFMETTR